MKTFQYDKPKTVAGIVELLHAGGATAALLAGGTDLMAQLRSRLLQPELVLDLKGPEELRQLTRDANGLSVGAAVVLNRLLEEPTATTGYDALTQATAELASYPIRNRATLVGNVANASPCADSVPPLCVLGAEVELQGAAGKRRVPVAEFITGNRETVREPGELVTRLLLPALSPGSWSGYRKRKRVKGHDLALANAALAFDPQRKQLRLAVGSCSPRPVLVDLSDMADRPDAEEALRRVQDGIRPIDDVRASVEYRRDMVSHMVRGLFHDLSHCGSAA